MALSLEPEERTKIENPTGSFSPNTMGESHSISQTTVFPLPQCFRFSHSWPETSVCIFFRESLSLRTCSVAVWILSAWTSSSTTTCQRTQTPTCTGLPGPEDSEQRWILYFYRQLIFRGCVKWSLRVLINSAWPRNFAALLVRTHIHIVSKMLSSTYHRSFIAFFVNFYFSHDHEKFGVKFR